MAEPLVLALDGSTRRCSVALLEFRTVSTMPGREGGNGPGGPSAAWRLAAHRMGADGRGQAQALLGLVEEILEEAGSSRDDLSAVVVGTGPGTFTGVRIAVATARALSLALSVPVLGVSTLAALAANAAVTVAGRPAQAGGSRDAGTDAAWVPADRPVTIPDRLVPVVDARRGQVFFTIYERRDDDGQKAEALWRRTGAYGACDASDLGKVLTGTAETSTMVVGAERSLVGGLPARVVFREEEVRAEHLLLGQECLDEGGGSPQGLLLTPWLAAWSGGGGAGTGHACETPGHAGPHGLLEPGGIGSPESVRPIYVRAPDADIHITKMKDPWGDGPGAR